MSHKAESIDDGSPMAQASAWIQEEIECLEEREDELEKEIREIEERMRAEEAAAPPDAGMLTVGGQVFASRRDFAYQLGKGRREEERRKCARSFPHSVHGTSQCTRDATFNTRAFHTMPLEPYNLWTRQLQI